MKLLLIAAFLGLVATQPSASRSQSDPKDVQLVRSEVENNGDGTYSYRYELSDGTIVEEKGSLKPPAPGSDEPIRVAEGSYQYVSEDGVLIKTTYIADEGGFRASGDHLPTPPPIPPEIQETLKLIFAAAADQLLIVAFFGIVVAQSPASRPKSNPKDVQLVRSEVENNGDGTYSYRYELSDGTIVEEKGTLKPPQPGSEYPTRVAEGSYQYASEDGVLIKTTYIYIADEGGFRASGDHLPTPPPIPPEIQASLKLVLAAAADQAQSGKKRV